VVDFDAAQKICAAGAGTSGVFATIEPGRKLMSNYALRVPESLLAYARLVAQEEKVSALKTEAYFKERQARGDLAGGGWWLSGGVDASATTAQGVVPRSKPLERCARKILGG
jgi:hypothetical protein